jgi:hypothetical protein
MMKTKLRSLSPDHGILPSKGKLFRWSSIKGDWPLHHKHNFLAVLSSSVCENKIQFMFIWASISVQVHRASWLLRILHLWNLWTQGRVAWFWHWGDQSGLQASEGQVGTQIVFYVNCFFSAHWNYVLVECRFHYMAMADNRQRIMPMPDDRLPPRGQQLAYPEAVLLVDPINPKLRGEVS